MNKYVGALLALGIIILNETAPFLYNEAYTVKDMKWGWIISFPVLLLIASSVMKNKSNNEE